MVEQFFFPEGWGGAEIPRDIAIGLRQAGFEVDVLCGRDQYVPVSGAAALDPASFGVGMIRVPRIVPGPVHRFKSMRILLFCACALPRLLFHRGVDMYVTQTNPLLVVPTVAIAAALRGKPFVIIAQDLYPEALFASHLSRADSLVGKALQRLFSWAYRRATRVVALGSCMRRRILSKGVREHRVCMVSNWATGDLRPSAADARAVRESWKLDDRFVLLYSGNMGVGHEFETLLRGVGQAVAAGVDAVAVFIGGGVRLPEVRALAAALSLVDRVMFRDSVSADVLSSSLGVADLGVVTLRSGFEGVILPSKLLGYMARAIPVLYVGPDGDVADMIRDADCGAICRPQAVDEVADAIVRAAADRALLRRWGANGGRCYAERFTRELALRRYADIMREALRAPGGSA